MAIIHWFRRDLRLADNTALNAALSAGGGAVIPVFVLDDGLLRGEAVAPARVQFMLECLRDLDAALRARGSRLLIRRGSPQSELTKLAAESGASAVYFNRDYTPAARRRDTVVTEALRANGVSVHSFKDAVVFEPDEIRTGQGTPYTVYTPYKNAWLARLEAALPLPMDAPWPAGSSQPGLATLAIPTPAELGFKTTQKLPRGGQAVAKQLLELFASQRIQAYATSRDSLSLDGTSRLSPHLRFGTLSPRQCVRAALDARVEEGSTVFRAKAAARNGADVWLSELIWREFYAQVLFHFPHADTGNFKREYDALIWGSGNARRDQERFAAWCEGRTGYPVVDAAMRQLNAIGWMHNRARMIVASFLTKDLLLDWRWGERYFMQKLVDGDPASNNGGWQWAASTGTDAQPYFRIFNPLLQAERFDPDGTYVRTWVKELERVPKEHIHTPTSLPPMLALTTNAISYPKPIVDHATQKDEVLRRFKAVRTARD